MSASSRRPSVARRPRGFSLIIALVMLAVIGLAAAAVMRNATGADQIATANRLLTQANQSAQLALRFCENQLTLPGNQRTVALPGPAAGQGWTQRARWQPAVPGGAHTLVAGDVGSPPAWRTAPQCLLDATARPDVLTVTARGFGADYRASAMGETLGGSVVWLQSTVLLSRAPEPAPDDGGRSSGSGIATGPAPPAACTSGCTPTILQRVWQQLLTPPF